jgi:hypothetical protein
VSPLDPALFAPGIPPLVGYAACVLALFLGLVATWAAWAMAGPHEEDARLLNKHGQEIR